MSEVHQWIRQTVAEGRRWHKLPRETDAATVVAALGFEGTLRAAYGMLYNERAMTSVRVFACDVLDALRSAEAGRWRSDWRHEAFLALCADAAREIERRNAAWDRAFNLAKPEMPVEFAFLIARTTATPSTAPVDVDEAIRMLEAGMAKHPAAEGAARLAILHRKRGDSGKESEWLAKERELKAKGAKLRPLLPPPLEGEHYLGPHAG